MIDANVDQQKLQMPIWSPGDEISAARLNTMCQGIVAGQRGANSPRQNEYPKTSGSIIRQVIYTGGQFFGYQSVGYQIPCVTWDGTTQGTDQIIVALPYLLRAETWNGYTDADGVSYQSTSMQTMTATRASDNTVEHWKIVFPYAQGDLLYIMANIRGGTDSQDFNGNDVDWVDMNVDARAWAKV